MPDRNASRVTARGTRAGAVHPPLEQRRSGVGAGRGATIREVADRAGVSFKTVSRVVNNEPNVRPETRARVLEAIAALDYEPHPAARGLAGRRTHSIGLLYENPHEFSYIQKVLEGAYAACEAVGHALLLRPCTANSAPAEIRQFVRQTRVDGVLLTAPIADREDVTSMLVDSGVRFALVSPHAERRDWPSVSPDDAEAGRVLTAHLVALGHRRIGFIQGDPRHGASHKRLAGHVDCLRSRSLAVDPALIVDGNFDFESGQRGFGALFELPDPPTAVIAGNDDTAAGVVVAAHERGIRVPSRLSVAGFDDSPTAMHTWPALTTVRQPIAAIASRAAELLIADLAGRAPSQETFPCELIVRASTAEPSLQREIGP